MDFVVYIWYNGLYIDCGGEAYMKENLLREIYFGTYTPKRDRYDAADRNAFDEILSMYEDMLKEIPDSMKDRFRQFADRCLTLLSDRSEMDFAEGYRLGVRLMVEALREEPNSR